MAATDMIYQDENIITTTNNNNNSTSFTDNDNITLLTTDLNAMTTIFIAPITSEEVLWYFRLIAHGILGQILAILGAATNVINIIVFFKLGIRRDPMNVSLLGLSVSDFSSCFTVIFLNLCLTPGFTEKENLPFSPITIHYLFSTWPHAICVKITILITAFITVERCLCVTYPLKIRQLFTTKRVACIIVSLYLFVIFLTAPIYHMFKMKWVFYSSQNRSIYTLIYHEDRDKIEPPLYTVFSLIVPPTAFAVTILCTVVLVYNLKKMAEWRKEVTSTSTNHQPVEKQQQQPQQQQSKDVKVSKMVAVISSLYLACYLPVTAGIFASVTVPELKQGGAYQNTMYAMFAPIYLLESTNASLNIFIYYSMSTNYKTMIRSLFSKQTKKG